MPDIRPSQLRLLRARRFLPLFTTQFLGAFNDNVYKNALIIYITFLTAAGARSDSARLVTIAAGIFILPFFLFSATAGQIADKYEKSMLIRRVKLGEIAIMTLAGLGFWVGNVWFLMAILFLMGTQSAVFGPLKYSILPQHLAPGELISGNALVQMATFLAILLGTMLGGFVVAVQGTGPTLVSAVVLCLAVAGWLASRSIPRAAPADPRIAVDWNLLSQTVEVMRLSRENRHVLAATLGIAWFWFLGATYLQLLPAYTRDVLGGNAHVVTLLLSAFSIGIGLGSILCGRISAGRIELALVTVGGLGLSVFSAGIYVLSQLADPAPETRHLLGIAGFLAQPHHWWVFLDLLAVSTFGGLYIVPLFTLLQSRAAPQHRARVIAASNIVSALFMVMSALATLALLSLRRSTDEILLFVGLANLVVIVVIAVLLPESLRRSAKSPARRREAEAGGPTEEEQR